MEYLNVLINAAISTIIIGIAAYFIQKQIDKRFNKIEEFQRTLITIRKEKYDTLLKALQEIWEKIVETEYYIRYGLVDQVIDAQKNKKDELNFDKKPLMDTLIFIEKRSILLTPELSTHVREFFETNLAATYNGYIDACRTAIAKQDLNELNNYIPNKLGEEYKEKLATLRIEFETQARAILYDEDKKPTTSK